MAGCILQFKDMLTIETAPKVNQPCGESVLQEYFGFTQNGKIVWQKHVAQQKQDSL